MSQEAIRLALNKAFQLGQRYWSWADSEYSSHWKKADAAKSEFDQLVQDTINAALAEQPAQQEPVLQDIEQYRLQMAGISTAAIGYWKESDGIHPDYDTIALRDVAKLYAKYDELYRAQRTWVGLTDDEIDAIWDAAITPSNHILVFARAIEAKLKEKNNV